jgi:hypothetical protein
MKYLRAYWKTKICFDLRWQDTERQIRTRREEKWKIQLKTIKLHCLATCFVMNKNKGDNTCGTPGLRWTQFEKHCTELTKRKLCALCCSVDRAASPYNSGKWPTWRTILFFICLLQSSTCFEQPHHHQENQLYQYNVWYMLLCIGGRLVCRSGGKFPTCSYLEVNYFVLLTPN